MLRYYSRLSLGAKFAVMCVAGVFLVLVLLRGGPRGTRSPPHGLLSRSPPPRGPLTHANANTHAHANARDPARDPARDRARGQRPGGRLGDPSADAAGNGARFAGGGDPWASPTAPRDCFVAWQTARERAGAAGLLAGALAESLVRVPLAVDATALMDAVMQMGDEDPRAWEDVEGVQGAATIRVAGRVREDATLGARDRVLEVHAGVAAALGALRAPIASAAFFRVPPGEAFAWEPQPGTLEGEGHGLGLGLGLGLDARHLRLVLPVSGRAELRARKVGTAGPRAERTEVVVPGEVWAVSRDVGQAWVVSAAGGREDSVFFVVETLGGVDLLGMIAQAMQGGARAGDKVSAAGREETGRGGEPGSILLESWVEARPWTALDPAEVDAYMEALHAKLMTGKNVTPIMRQKLTDLAPGWTALLQSLGLDADPRRLVTPAQAADIAAWVDERTRDLAETWCRSDGTMVGPRGQYRALPHGPSTLDAVEPLLRDLLYECSGGEAAAAGLFPSSEERPPCSGSVAGREAHLEARERALVRFEAERPEEILAAVLDDPRWAPKPHAASALDRSFVARRTDPIIFVGGVPRSGTTLMRVLLDAHPDVRCGEETRVVPEFLAKTQDELRNLGRPPKWKERSRLDAAGVTYDVQLEAAALYVLRIIEGHGEPAKYLCNKDPMAMLRATFAVELFPSARFIFMVRDGRSVAHSLVEREVSIGGIPNSKGTWTAVLDATGQKQVSMIDFWAQSSSRMDEECRAIPANCMPVVYERLTTALSEYLPEVLAFAGVPWDDRVLHHEEQFVRGSIASETISLSGLEPSTEQVVKAVHTDATRKWAEDFTPDVVHICNDPSRHSGAMLRHFGYIDALDRDVLAPVYPPPDDERDSAASTTT